MSETESERTINDLVFAALNSRVIALDRYDGTIVWTWKSPKSASFVTLLVDGDRLIASANGYIYCLDPVFGQEVWNNPLKGLGVGITSLASVHGQTGGGGAAAKKAQQARRAAAAGGAAAAAG
jgi:outer membrane protein assembly factor BamB